ncbi:transcription termination/antitermination protein NusG [Ponticaulis sp.]|uniref:transcription termination/antitermination protein NusG n=1 Tax=Ponticaulis sp. TaxID=2020902 RepID=UPI000B6EC872|nr:transcription termination/antitermination protein NusG [Ponticaulis sp.]MAI91992.1 transcription termination/antitermination protein NusG [Ponticaulis sp.]OUX96459.1 MAG: transcription termination/antitermination protein NusG [Hyphomonadaceae bacterium TMED5]|tara:strand:+ start:74638 stop:75195 length:558 start_codon:yes stop_codon:yes gene_type:complete
MSQKDVTKARWYIVHAYSNFEKKVAASILEQARMNDLDHLIEQMEVPTEEVVEVVRGRKRTREQRYFPGYVLMKAFLTDDIYHIVKNTPKVTGFLGAEGGKKPLPVSEREVQRILGEAEESADRPRPTISFEVGEQVRVNDGPFQSFEGSVEEVDEENGRLKVMVSIFGRATPVDLEYGQVDKVA